METQSNLSDARLALLVTGSDLPMEEIEQLLELKPTRAVRKGDLINRLPEMFSEQDEWVYAIQLTAPSGTDMAMVHFLEHLTRHREHIHQVKKLGRVTLRLFVQSDYAQMTYNLTPATLGWLAGINLTLEISSLSWGEVGI